MEKNNPSRTAFKVALMRAAHQIIDAPLVFEDPVALDLAGTEFAEKIKSDPDSFNKGLNKNFRAIVTARSSLVEEKLNEAVNEGIMQYVILGAGFDTFAYRNTIPSLKVFEVDYPPTQNWKIKKLNESGINIPENLTFVPVDFETQNLGERLEESGFNRNIPAFISWLGVSMYLEKETMLKTLEFISKLSKKSCIVFDYVVPVSSSGIIRRIIYLFLKRRLRLLGEPWINFLEPKEIKNELIKMGFSKVTDFGPHDINMKFFNDRDDGLKAGQAGHIIIAEL